MFAPIVRVNIPMNDTDRSAMCVSYEADMFKLRWSDRRIKQRDRAREIDVTPLALDGDLDPYKEVDDCDHEMQRMIKLHGETLFFQCYNVASFKQAYNAACVERNEWRERAEAAALDAEATAQAAAAVKTAQLVDQAVAGIRRARDADEAADAEREDTEAAALVGAQTQDAQDDKPRRGRPPGVKNT